MSEEVRKIDFSQSSQELKSLETKAKDVLDIFTKLPQPLNEILGGVANRLKPKKFYQKAAFWTAFMAVSGLLGLIITYQSQQKTMTYNMIQRKINNIIALKSKEVKAIVSARALVLNQNLECPLKSHKKLILMRQKRIDSLVNIASYISGFNFENYDEARRIVDREIVARIYNIDTLGICKINAQNFDDKLKSSQTHFTELIQNVINREVGKQRKIQKSIIVI